MPSIVWGILGVVVFAQLLRAHHGPEVSGLSYISGGLTLAVLVMPFLIIITMEALRAVPQGSARLPTASGPPDGRWSGATSCPMQPRGVHRDDPSWARAFETAPILLVGAGHRLPHPGGGDGPIDTLQGKYTALPTIIYSWAGKPGEDGPHSRPLRSWCC